MKTLTAASSSLLALGLLLVPACKETKKEEPHPVASAPSLQQNLPAAFAGVRLAMTTADVLSAFPTTELLDKCAFRLTDDAAPPAVPGSDSHPSSSCALLEDVGGVTRAELTSVLEATNSEVNDDTYALLRNIEQLRASVRAGSITSQMMIEANKRAANVTETVAFPAAVALDGMGKLSKNAIGRRAMCATISTDCDGFDAELIRRFVTGGYNLGQLDADAHSRVVYGKCRSEFLAREKKALRPAFIGDVGTLGLYGLAKTIRGTGEVNPSDSSTYRVALRYTGIDDAPAKVLMLAGQNLTKTESYWNGAIALHLAKEAASIDSPWSSRALVWLKNGKVVRLLLGLLNIDKVSEAQAELAKLYGQGQSSRHVTRWTLRDGSHAALDLGAAAALTVEDVSLTNQDESAAPIATSTGAPAVPSSLTPAPSEKSAATVAPTAAAKAAPTQTPQASSRAATKGPGRAECMTSCVAKCAGDDACEQKCVHSCPK